MVSNRPFLSVVMPLHEGSEWIAATLESVAAEPTDGVELVIIDSSPTDTTARIVETFSSRLPLRLMRRTDIKPWQTKTNIGVERATAKHVCILHQDDLWLPGRIDAARRWINRTSDAALHLAPTVIVDRNGRRLGTWNCPLPAERVIAAEFLMERLLVQNFVSVPAPVFRRSAWLDCGGMDEGLWYTADWDMWAKLGGKGPVVYHRDLTTAFRVHGSSLTIAGSRDAGEFRSQMERVVDRHLTSLPPQSRTRVAKAAQASINVNVSLAAAAVGNWPAIMRGVGAALALGPVGLARYLRDSRLHERVASRLFAKMAGAF